MSIHNHATALMAEGQRQYMAKLEAELLRFFLENTPPGYVITHRDTTVDVGCICRGTGVRQDLSNELGQGFIYHVYQCPCVSWRILVRPA